jgi:hypothetical protein
MARRHGGVAPRVSNYWNSGQVIPNPGQKSRRHYLGGIAGIVASGRHLSGEISRMVAPGRHLSGGGAQIVAARRHLSGRISQVAAAGRDLSGSAKCVLAAGRHLSGKFSQIVAAEYQGVRQGWGKVVVGQRGAGRGAGTDSIGRLGNGTRRCWAARRRAALAWFAAVRSVQAEGLEKNRR